ncbi:MAG: PAS domain S-box protein [Balneolaceae bacterium]
MSDKLISQTFNQLLLGIIVVFAVAVFILDIFVPLGVSGGMVYVLFVMATYWIKDSKITIAAGIAGSILIVAGFYFSTTSAYILLSFANHIVAIIVVWATVWFVNSYKSSLQRIRKDYRGLFQAANDEILVFQLDEKNHAKPFSEVNDTACEMLGYSREELLKKTVYDISSAEKEEIERRIANVIEHGEIIFESRHRTKAGDSIPLELSIRSFTYNGQKAIISVGRDLRERYRLEQEVLNASEQERQRIGRDMHDDLGQLLSVATITTQMLAREMKTRGMEETKKIEEIAGMIKTAGERSRTLSHGLVPFNVEQNGLNEALQELTNSVSVMYGIEAQYTGSKNVLLTGNYAALHLYRIAQEAINNAVKHGKASSIEVELSSSIDDITLLIKDNGRGLPKSKTMKEGIGLRIMKFRANMIGGDLKITSEKGEGTEVMCRMSRRVN